MKFRLIFKIILLLSVCLPGLLAAKDYTDALKFIGNPYLNRYATPEQAYARNIWNMQVFDHKIFLAAGNSSNRGPASNAGPVPIMTLDPATDQFAEEGQVNDEQIGSFVILNKQLTIPGHDPREDWSAGNYYQRLEKGFWLKTRNIPNALHNYAMVEHGGIWFAGLGLNDGGAIVASYDQGKTWKTSLQTSARVYNFFQADKKLYAVNSLKVEDGGVFIFEHHDDQGFVARGDLTPKVMFPETELISKKKLKIIRAQSFKNQLIYIGAYAHNDHQDLPFGVYFAESLSSGKLNIKKVTLPETSIPWDILQDAQQLFILASADDIYHPPITNYVFRASLSKVPEFSTHVQFSAESFARSFEWVNQTFYFGLGAEIANSTRWNVSELSSHAGDILKLKPVIQ